MSYSRRYSSDAPTVIENTNSQVEASYQCDRGTATIYIEDELLTGNDVALERAEAEFLKQSYKERVLTVSTYHVDDMAVGSLIEVNGTMFKTVSVEDIIEGVKAYMQITMKRWE